MHTIVFIARNNARTRATRASECSVTALGELEVREDLGAGATDNQFDVEPAAATHVTAIVRRRRAQAS